jgi:hypothetical protein
MSRLLRHKMLLLALVLIGIVLGTTIWGDVTIEDNNNATTRQISAYQFIDDSLVGYWQFANDANDSSHYGNNGILHGGASITQGVLHLDGVDDFVTIEAATSLAVTDTLTVSAWVRYDKQSETGDHDVFWDGAYYWRYGLRRTDNNYRFVMYNTATSSWLVLDTQGITFDKDVWYHLVATFKNGESVKLYVNGTLNASLNLSTSVTLNPHTRLHIGVAANSGQGGEWFPGYIDEVRLYNRCLQDWEIRRMYNENSRPYTEFNSLRVAGDIDIGDAGGFSGMTFNRTNTTLDFYIDGTKVAHIEPNGTYVDDVP